jgi:hypothetical protein
LKPWKSEIEKHIAHWSKQLIGREWWPRFVYHYTDVQNAVNILKAGMLYSRTEATRRGLMVSDNALYSVIQQTKPTHLEFARFYFRPRTPTQFRNEGIRPPNRRWQPDPLHPPAHCPVPVFFCFDALSVIGRDDTEFSNGNMGSGGTQHAATLDFFKQIPFQ